MKMKLSVKAALAAVCVAAAAGNALARTAADFFTEAPGSVLPLLDRNARLDMIDYFRHGLPTTTTNLFNGASKVLSESENCIDVQISRDASLQIALLPLKNDTIIAVIETVLTPVADSGITFYRSDWSPVPVQPAMPAAADFIPKDRRKELKDAEMPPAAYIRASFNSNDGSFDFINTTPAYYTADGAPEGMAAMRHSIAMRFDGKRFIKITRPDEK